MKYKNNKYTNTEIDLLAKRYINIVDLTLLNGFKMIYKHIKRGVTYNSRPHIIYIHYLNFITIKCNLISLAGNYMRLNKIYLIIGYLIEKVEKIL